MFRKLNLFPSSSVEKEAHTLFGPLERQVQWLRLALSNGPNRVGVSLSLSFPSNLGKETDPVSETLSHVALSPQANYTN
jgi:hypothetical protein